MARNGTNVGISPSSHSTLTTDAAVDVQCGPHGGGQVAVRRRPNAISRAAPMRSSRFQGSRGSVEKLKRVVDYP